MALDLVAIGLISLAFSVFALHWRVRRLERFVLKELHDEARADRGIEGRARRLAR